MDAMQEEARRLEEAEARYQAWAQRRESETARPVTGTESCDECGTEAPAAELDEYLRCRRCLENWESSQEGPFDDGGPSLQEQCRRAHALKEGR